jgi:hypothetical protein
MESTGFETFNKKVYRQVLFYSYFFFPILSIFCGVLFLGIAFNTESNNTTLLATLGFVASQYISLRFTKLMIVWRQVLKIKSSAEGSAVKGQSDVRKRLYGTLFSLMVLHFLGSIFYIPEYLHSAKEVLQKVILVLSATGLISLLIYSLFRSKKITSRKSDFSLYTAIFTVPMALIIALFTILDIRILSDFGFNFYNAGMASYLFLSAVTWAYTFLGLLVTRQEFQKR